MNAKNLSPLMRAEQPIAGGYAGLLESICPVERYAAGLLRASSHDLDPVALEHFIRSMEDLITESPGWESIEPTSALTAFAETLRNVLNLEFVILSIQSRDNDSLQDIVASVRSNSATEAANDALWRWKSLCDNERPASPAKAHQIFNGCRYSLAMTEIGSRFGWIIAASNDQGFPERSERLLLRLTALQLDVTLSRLLSMSTRPHTQNESTNRNADGNAFVDECRFRRSEAATESAAASLQLHSAIQSIVLRFTVDGVCESANQAFRDFTGLPEAISQHAGWQQVVHPDDLVVLSEKWRASAPLSMPWKTEARLRGRDGQYRWFGFSFDAEIEGLSRIKRWHGVAIDVDDLKEAEVAWLVSRNNLFLTVNAIPTQVWTARPDGYADFFNEKWLTYTGLSAKDAEGWGWSKALHPDDLDAYMASWRSLVQTRQAGEIEARLRRSDGTYRWFLFRADNLRDGRGIIVKWFGVNTDIHDRKIAEEEVRRSEALLTETQRRARIGSFSWRIHNDEIRWSAALDDIFQADVAGSPASATLYQRIHPEDWPRFEEKLENARAGAERFDYDGRITMPDGALKHIQLDAYLTTAHDGAVEYIGTIQDVTQRRSAYDALMRARGELTRVAAASGVGILAASIAHEITQPLSGIMINANICLSMLNKEPPDIPGADKTVRRAIRDGNRATEVVKRLRDLYSKRETSKMLLDLDDIAREAVELSLPELRAQHITVFEQFARNLPLIEGDRVQLQEVILNLIRNASDAMATVVDRSRHLTISSERDGELVRLMVKDSGIGLDEGSMSRIFESFYSTKKKGMGIGLSISRSIIETHGGMISVTRNPRHGVTFLVELPYAETR